jgi:hypothetical protein
MVTPWQDICIHEILYSRHLLSNTIALSIPKKITVCLLVYMSKLIKITGSIQVYEIIEQKLPLICLLFLFLRAAFTYVKTCILNLNKCTVSYHPKLFRYSRVIKTLIINWPWPQHVNCDTHGYRKQTSI